jgi:hypothetical protein
MVIVPKLSTDTLKPELPNRRCSMRLLVDVKGGFVVG